MEILATHKESFGTDFNKNKQILNDISIVRSKELKNELAGYITKYIKREIAQQKENEEKEEQAEREAKKQLEEEIESKSTGDFSSLDESLRERQKEIISETSN